MNEWHDDAGLSLMPVGWRSGWHRRSIRAPWEYQSSVRALRGLPVVARYPVLTAEPVPKPEV